MPNKDKSTLIKRLNSEMDLLYGNYLKKVRSKNDFKTRDREEFFEYINRPENFRLRYQFQGLEKEHVIHFIKLNNQYLVVTLNFPSYFSNYAKLRKEAVVYIRFGSTYDSQKDKAISLSFKEFQDILKDYHFVNNICKKYEVYDRFSGSPTQHRNLFFEKIMFSEERHRINFIDSFKEDEESICKIMELKNQYIDQRRKNNKTKKDNKKKNNGFVQAKVRENESEIRKLQRKIQNLQNENSKLKNQHISAISKEDSEAAITYEQQYENAAKNFLVSRLGRFRKSEFCDIYEKMILEK